MAKPKRVVIRISLDDDLNFKYTDQSTHKSAKRLEVSNGDQIVWALDPAIPERFLQIDFDVINPFQTPFKLSLRGKDRVVSSPVKFPPGYLGDPNLKYTVSLGNGLSDDPDIVPVGPDGLETRGVKPPQTHDFDLFWDPDKQTLNIDPKSVRKPVDGKTAWVVWGWNSKSSQQVPFSLKFDDPKPWGASTRYSADDDNDNPYLPLPLPPGKSGFTVTAVLDSGNEFTVKGELEVTPK